jgi:hypothetical protein
MNVTQKLCLRALEKSAKPLTVAQVSELTNIALEQCRHSLTQLNKVGRIYIAAWSHPYQAKMYLYGAGKDAPKPPRMRPPPTKTSQADGIVEERRQRIEKTMERRAAVSGTVWEMVI